MIKYINSPSNKEKKTNFFSSVDLLSIAIDSSGSTSGSIMNNQKEIISTVINGTKCEKILDSILAWEDTCQIQALDKIKSGGCTDPSCIFEKLNPKVENLIITTDGYISSGEVQKTREKISKFTNLKNIICILFQEASSPSELNIAVFYPFLEHTKKLKGSFYLFYYHDKNLYLLIKKTPNIFDNNTIFKSPPLEYTKETKWDEIPKNEYKDIQKIEVISQVIEDGFIMIPKSNELLNLKLLEKDILENKNKNDLTIVSSIEFNDFINENIFGLIDSCVDSMESENFNRLRNIVSEWKKYLIKKEEEENKIKNNDKDMEDKNKKIELYKELMEKKLKIKDTKSEEYNKIKEQLKVLSKEIFDTVKEKIKNRAKDENYKSCKQSKKSCKIKSNRKCW